MHVKTNWIVLVRYFVAALVACLLCTGPSQAQREKHEPLTAAEIEEIRDAGIVPEQRVNLYTKYLGEHADALKALAARRKSAARADALDEQIQNLTALLDETGSNLDVYSDHHADIRKSLKKLTEAMPHLLEILKALPVEHAYDLSLKEALESYQDLSTQADQMLKEQTEYFKLHKDEKNQERAEPK
jgi:hypothetical protein